MIVSVVFYVWIIFKTPSSAKPNPTLLYAITAVAVAIVAVLFVFRRMFVARTEASLTEQPDDPKLLLRLRQGYVVTYALSESIVLYGVVLHFVGFRSSQVIPFFIAGFLLMSFLRPKPMNREFPAVTS